MRRVVDRAPWPPAPCFDVVSVYLDVGIREKCAGFSIIYVIVPQPDNCHISDQLSGADVHLDFSLSYCLQPPVKDTGRRCSIVSYVYYIY